MDVWISAVLVTVAFFRSPTHDGKHPLLLSVVINHRPVLVDLIVLCGVTGGATLVVDSHNPGLNEGHSEVDD